MSREIIILGAGLAGLSCAYHYGSSAIVHEKQNEPGGLVRTIANGSHKFDLAPHLLHIRNTDIFNLITDDFGLVLKAHQRQARIFIDGSIIPYPFELNLSGVSQQTRNDCLDGLEQIETHHRKDEVNIRAGSYGEYAMKAFGPGIANHYLLPYNRKIWDTDPYLMTCEWMRFLPTVDVGAIRASAFVKNTSKFGYNTEFYYPVKHGIRELADAFAVNVQDINYGKQATAIDLEKRQVTFNDSEIVVYEDLVSTIPLTSLASISDSEALKDLAKGLAFTTVYVINIVVKGLVPDDTHWIYFPDPNLSFYRISLPKAYFDAAAPAGEHIISVEVGSRQHDLAILELEHKVLKELRSLDIFRIDEVVKIHTEKIRAAYVIYDKERTERVAAIKGILEGFGVKSIGRYGNWEYAAMEDAIIQGRDAALQLKGA